MDKSKHFNFSNISPDRKWLQEILVEQSDESDTSGDEVTEDDLKLMLKHHVLVKKYKKKYYDDKDVSESVYCKVRFFKSNCFFLEFSVSIL